MFVWPRIRLDYTPTARMALGVFPDCFLPNTRPWKKRHMTKAPEWGASLWVRGSGAFGVLMAALTLLSPSLAPAATKTLAEFYARSPYGRGISCAVYDGYAGSAAAMCESVRPRRQSKATLYPSGHLTLCSMHNLSSNRCDLGNAGEGTPTFGYGHRVTVGRFRCIVLRKGVVCRVRSSGEGFEFNPRRMASLGGAKVHVVRAHRRD
jgi:hypothetical protein